MMFDLPKEEESIIKVLGVGGGGCNAVTHMYKQGIVGVDFIVCNTDGQSMELSPVPMKIQLGPHLTEGRGAGSKPEIGRQACEESIEDIRRVLDGHTKMLFVTAGMGGGTGTGAAPIIARLGREMGILTVGIVTLPFTFEGRKRMQQAKEGLDELRREVDSLIMVSNDKLREIYGNLPLSAAFAKADDILATAAKGIAEIITVPGYINVDFEDVNTVMRESGVAIMGISETEGEERARKAVDEALTSPLLEENDIRGAQHILVNITSGAKEVTMDEIFEITEYVQEEAGFETDLIWGNCYDESLGDKISVTIIATGFDRHLPKKERPKESKIVVPLEEENTRKKAEEGLYEVGLDDGDESPTVTFEDVQRNVEYHNKKNTLFDEPRVKENASADELPKRKRTTTNPGRKRQEPLARPTHTGSITEIENEPAYKRRNVTLDDIEEMEEVQKSRYIISDDDEPIIKDDNSYLHDNVD